MKTEGRIKSLLEEEFDGLEQIFDDRKPVSVASSEENRIKNRYETTNPFDRNRVILTPVAGRDYSTYINASFVEGYDNSECFILTQDPMESTQRDFWIAILRLLEHNIVVIVMLSEMGDRRFGHFLLPAENPDGANICRQRESGPSLTMERLTTTACPSQRKYFS